MKMTVMLVLVVSMSVVLRGRLALIKSLILKLAGKPGDWHILTHLFLEYELASLGSSVGILLSADRLQGRDWILRILI